MTTTDTTIEGAATADRAHTTLRGRPRDPLLESRVYDAAIGLYAEAGWPGFSFEAIARRAGVGKAALYRRWSARGDLLRHTLEARWLRFDHIDTGNLRDDLLELVRVACEVRTGPYAGTALHMIIDIERSPEAAAVLAPYGLATVRYARDIVARAVARGELDASVNPGLVVDLLIGAVTNHIASTPKALRDTMVAQLPAFAASIVDVVVGGLQARRAPG